MKNRITKAVKAGDIGGARILIIESLDRNPGRKDTMEAVRLAMKSLPELFEDEDGTVSEYGDVQSTAKVKEKLAGHLGKNFSREKLAVYTRVCIDSYGKPAAPDPVGDALERIAEANENDRMQETVDELHFEDFNVPMVGSPDHAETVSAASDGDEEPEEKRDLYDLMKDPAERPDTPGARKGRLAGYAVIIIGIICAIVGIAIPLFFLIGIGIGVIFTGAFVTYANLRN